MAAANVFGSSDLERNHAVVEVAASSTPGSGGAASTTLSPVVTLGGTATGDALPIQGAGAAGTAAVGSPVRVGGVYSSTVPTYTTGQAGDLQLGPRGQLLVTQAAIATAGADNISSTFLLGYDMQTGSSRIPSALGFAFGGTGCDRLRTIQGSDGTGLGVQAMAPAPQSSAAGAIVPVVGSLVSNIVGKASAGNLYGAEITAGATALWLYVFNATSKPADGAVTAGNASGNYQFCIPVAANARVEHAFNIPERYSVGITLVASSTGPGTLTASTTPVFIKARVQ